MRKITLRIPVVVCRDGAWNAGGWGNASATCEADLAILYDAFPDTPESDIGILTFTAEVDLDAVFRDVTVEGIATSEREEP